MNFFKKLGKKINKTIGSTGRLGKLGRNLEKTGKALLQGYMGDPQPLEEVPGGDVSSNSLTMEPLYVVVIAMILVIILMRRQQ